MSETTPSPTEASVLSRLLDEQSRCWQQGEHVSVEGYLQRHPELRDNVPALLDLIYHEILLRERAGERPILEEYLQRFPAHAPARRFSPRGQLCRRGS
jgi:hypothetical protein